MRREEAFPRKKNPKPLTKLLRLLDKGNHVSRHWKLQQRWDDERKKNPLIHLSFLARDTMWFFFFFTYILLSEISARGNKPDPGGFVCWCAERGCVRRRKPIQQSARPVSSGETGKDANHKESEHKFTRYKPAFAVCSAAKPVCRALSGGSRSWAHKSLSPSAPKHQTNSHSSSDWLPECCCCCLHGQVLPLPDFQADFDSTLVVLPQKKNTLVFLSFRKAWSSITEAHTSALPFA